ncbi:aminodeoxychorismate synthase, component I [Terrihabitans soli]|uniref:Probable branched-chain-amino-acid aminotransferase n=1 Tax=Terrihabitans soli TaxID=708113 RepID=A0A6S6QS05_9HYPH|nr:aminodeoxychorismate synthase component I [Terrihabitans soli]BCJ92416.1 aminodeoxychorismate synthase, component I [Terrihabitans soli]
MIPAGTVLLHDNSPKAGRSLLFEHPERMLTTRDASFAKDLIAEAETAIADGWHVAGYLSYELGHAFEDRLSPLLPGLSQRPLLWLGIYGPPRELKREEIDAWLAGHAEAEPARVTDVELSMSRADYAEAFEKVMEYIRAGDAYQINLTFLARFRLDGDPVALYRELCKKQPVAHGALINTGKDLILSLSPELFIERRGERIVTRPMKGTIRRGTDAAEDEALKAQLLADEKSRAENLMIVDLLRNDLGRVADMGSVEVERLFEIETYKSLHQMTSTISANLRDDAKLGSILQALFPCGSVTGAPKIRAMQIINEVESGPRGVYCGSIGYAAPDGDFSFNVAIRTAHIADGHGEIGIGGGIVADSRLAAEYDEALLKLKFFKEPHMPLGLIETLRFDEHGFYLLERHLERLETSAAFFEIPFSAAKARAVLEEAVSRAVEKEAQRVRLVLDDSGALSAKSATLAAMHMLRFVIADRRMDSSNPLLAHKTTERAIYDEPREQAIRDFGVDEVVFLNERGELTEGSFTNLFVEKGGALLTPALSCGLLPGTLRAQLIANGKTKEAVLTAGDLDTAGKIFLGNSVRGLVEAHWQKES